MGVGRAPTGSYALDVSGNANVSGYVQNNHPWFRATNTSGYTTALGGKVQYNSVTQDATNSFTIGTNSQFIAPVTGIYFFSATTQYITSKSDIYVVNQSTSKNIAGTTQAAGHFTVSGILHCTANDVVNVIAGG